MEKHSSIHLSGWRMKPNTGKIINKINIPTGYTFISAVIFRDDAFRILFVFIGRLPRSKNFSLPPILVKQTILNGANCTEESSFFFFYIWWTCFSRGVGVREWGGIGKQKKPLSKVMEMVDVTLRNSTRSRIN